jgi:hypothetical protein
MMANLKWTGEIMRLPGLMLALVLAFSGLAGIAQDDGGRAARAEIYARTLQTKMPLNDSEVEWSWFVSAENLDLFWYKSDCDRKAKIVSTWIHIYDYKDKTISLTRVLVKRNTKEMAITDNIIYNMNTGVVRGKVTKPNPEYFSIAPGTVYERLLGEWDAMDSIERMSKKGKKK